jgi:hypothetical protein
LDSLRGRSSLARRRLVAFSNSSTIAAATTNTNTSSSTFLCTLRDIFCLLFKFMLEAIAQHRVFCKRGDEALRS